MTYTLVLAVICGLEVVYEYRFHQNLFDTWSAKVFRGPFELVRDGGSGSALDVQGRRWVQGPAVSGLELVTMLSMALPIAVLGIIKSKGRGQYILYGLATGTLMYAMLATDRKSALVAPVAVFLTLAYFRRRRAAVASAAGASDRGRCRNRLTGRCPHRSPAVHLAERRQGGDRELSDRQLRCCPTGPVDPLAARSGPRNLCASNRPNRRLRDHLAIGRDRRAGPGHVSADPVLADSLRSKDCLRRRLEVVAARASGAWRRASASLSFRPSTAC